MTFYDTLDMFLMIFGDFENFRFFRTRARTFWIFSFTGVSFFSEKDDDDSFRRDILDLFAAEIHKTIPCVNTRTRKRIEQKNEIFGND